MNFSRICLQKFFIKSLIITGIFFASLCLVGANQPLKAKPLPKKECKILRDKLKQLKTDEAVMKMSKGFEWVKENVKGDDLLPIKEFIETEEQYKFRCPQPKKKKAPKPKPKKDLVKKDKKSNVTSKKVTKKKKKAPKKSSTSKKKTKKKTKKNSKLEKPKKTEPTLFETIFPSSGEEKEKSKS
jgi:outer membrane biosynthesis protein TonB